MPDAAWRLGAGELERAKRRGCEHAGASDIEIPSCCAQAATGWSGVAPVRLVPENFHAAVCTVAHIRFYIFAYAFTTVAKPTSS